MIVVKPALTAVPLILFLVERKWKSAFLYTVIYTAAFLGELLLVPNVQGFLNFILVASCGIFSRFMPGIAMGIYFVNTTTVSEFMACCDYILQSGTGEGGGTLSGGEKQRISIARAILKNAPIVILDEATASIDPENEHLIQAAISELAKGKTLITIAHRLATIENADQILVVDEGRIAQKGKHRELIRQEGKYLEFVRAREQTEGWQIQ